MTTACVVLHQRTQSSHVRARAFKGRALRVARSGVEMCASRPERMSEFSYLAVHSVIVFDMHMTGNELRSKQRKALG